MPSRSFKIWETEGASALDEIEAAHAAVGGVARGRRYATQQINQSYVVILSSRFQGFCRDLHSEATAQLVSVLPVSYQPILQREWTTSRQLDRGNPNAGNIGSDFAKLGMFQFWEDVYALHRDNKQRRKNLDDMMDWRNAIAHQDFKKLLQKGKPEIRLQEVRKFRKTCHGLARCFDKVVLAHIRLIGGPQLGW